MNNPFSTALQSIGENFKKVATGENPLFAPQAANLFGFNIQGTPIISARDLFLTQMESWFTSLPLTTQWIMLIHDFPKCINTEVMRRLEYINGSKQSFNINQAKAILTSYPLQKLTGCIFTQGIQFPGESFNTELININSHRGFLPAPIATGREAPTSMTIDFLETNTSFTDTVIRPWVIAGSHFGFIARNLRDPQESLKNVKTTITILQYTRTIQSISMIPRKIWTFYNCAPTSVSDTSMTYDSEPGGLQSGRNMYQTKWIFSHYSLENNLYLPLPTIINRIAKGKLPQIDVFKNTKDKVDITGLF